MIKYLKLVNFKNFENKEFFFEEKISFILGENSAGKTNCLEAICLFANTSINKTSLQNFIKIGKDFFYIEIKDNKQNKFCISYGLTENKKKFKINNKNVDGTNFFNQSFCVVVFSPIFMNLFYLGPELRRDFLDGACKSSYKDYGIVFNKYRKILNSRNKLLKSIFIGKSSIDEINFWNEKFIYYSSILYEYRLKFLSFLEKFIKNAKKYFSYEINIEFIYKTKIDKNDIENSIRKYINENINKEVLNQSTTIGIHLDDFSIKINSKEIKDFASRGEIKSIIIYLKLLEGIFIEKSTGKKPILIIDDLISELDENHKLMILNSIDYYQSFISNIYLLKGYSYIKI